MAYIDKGAIAVDNEDGDITDRIVTTGVADVDVNTAGNYNIVYTVTDDNGATATATRVVSVVPSTGYDLEMHVKSADPFHIEITKGVSGKMYLSLDGGNTYEEYPGYDLIPAGDNIRLMGKNITQVKFNEGYSSNLQFNSGVTELHVVKAYSLTSIATMLDTAKKLVSFTTAHKNVFPNVLSCSAMFYECSLLTKVGEINYANMTDFSSAFRGCTSLVCIDGTIDMQSSTRSSYMFFNTPALTAPNATEQATILSGTAWTNPNPCQ